MPSNSCIWAKVPVSYMYVTVCSRVSNAATRSSQCALAWTNHTKCACRSKNSDQIISALLSAATDALNNSIDAIKRSAEAETSLDTAESILEEQRQLVAKRTEDFETATNLAHKLNTFSTDLSEKLKLVRFVPACLKFDRAHLAFCGQAQFACFKRKLPQYKCRPNLACLRDQVTLHACEIESRL